ncbi:MAG: hybrid sensor histidine kinase/response regulator [Ectothiorhodospiraceae bacterium]|nr:hybrid sensor histidine kinase/response regulator [Ectothiorhodospiraceae bacterium]
MPDGLIITNLSGKIVDANEAATEIVGMDDKVQLVGRHVQEFVADEHRAGAGELLDSLLNAGEIRDAEFTIKKGEGAPVPIEISVSVVNSATGSPMGYVGVFRNIEHRIAADEQLRVLSETVKQSPVSVVITDRDGIIEYVNPAFMRMTGWDTGDCISSKSFLWNEDDEGYYHDMCKTLAEGKTWRSELMDKRSDGSEYWVHVAISPIYDEHGEVSRYLELREDITKRIRADRELKEAKEAAEIAARIKSEFLANMSHEIRTPMNGIIGMTTLLKDTSLTKEQKNLVDTLRTSGDTLLTIINDILDFSKIEAGHMELEEQPFSVLDCIQDTIDLLAPRAMDKGLDIGYIIEKNTPITIIGDTTRTRQVLVNLVGNAIKFTASGDILISVGAKHLENNKYAMEFSVRDTGIGISEEKVGRIFDSFTQADSSTARKYGGTGLGLAICRRISDMMGGSLSVESELGVGSTFSFSFPTLSKECRQPEFMNGASPHLSGKRLLVADDNPMMLEIVSHYAKMWGMEVAIADSGTGALAMFERNPDVDIAIADKHLPDMDGMQLVADLNVRSDGTVPFILMSPLGRNDSVNDELGVHIVKPIRPTGLYKALVSAFHAQSGDEIEQKEDEMLIDAHFAEKHPLRILLTEDNVVNQMVALNLLERMGYEADLAANGLEAVEAIERQRYDLILMDVQMPEMNGIEATREIIERWSDDRPRIIAMTAYAMESDKEECLEAGMDDYVGKPVKVDELAKALAKCEPRESVEELIEEITMYRAIDFEAVDQFNRDVTNGNGSYLTKLIDIFNGEAEKAINEIREGLQEQDAERIRSAAHSMKSGSGSVGAMHMMDLFARIEREARNESFDPIPTILNELEIEFSIAKENLQEIKARVEPSNGVHA